MQLIDGTPVYSATDLVGYLACEHLANLERAAAAGLTTRPMRADPELDRIAKRGLQHERRFLEALRAEGRSIVEIADDEQIAPSEADAAIRLGHAPAVPDRGPRLRARAAETLAAMRAGVDVVYQATFFEASPSGAGWLGFADFLRRVETPSALGDLEL